MSYFRLGLLCLTFGISACGNTSQGGGSPASDSPKSVPSNTYALLIGVNQYDHPQIADLTGPVNDANLLAEVLKNQGWQAQDITLLTDDSTAPTRANIVAGLEALVAKAREEDFIVLSFAGHGSRQPAQKTADNPEADGLDEFFLPKDTGDWDAVKKTTENIILDNDIWHYLKKLRAKGAFVWLIFDTCHAGTMTRVAEMARINWQMRYVKPERLGIPISPAMAHRGATHPSRPDSEGIENGGHVAFYATQSWQLAPELPLPRDSQSAQMHGLFTYTLAQEILPYLHRTITYRQLSQQIRQNYLAQNIYDPAPWVEGEDLFLDRPLFEPQTQAVHQWPLREKDGIFTIPAGRLHGLETGTVLAVLAKPTDDMENDALGYVEITQAGVFESVVRTIEQGSKAALTVDKIPPRAYARVYALHVTLTLRVALPAGHQDASQPVWQALTALQQTDENIGIDWVKAPDATADVHLHLQDEALWLVPQDGVRVTEGKNRTASLSVQQDAETLHDQLVSALQRIAKVHNLLQLADAMTGEQMAQVIVHVEKINADKSVTPLAPGIPALKHGTQLRYWVENREQQAVDVTLLYLDSRYGVYVDYPDPVYEAVNRIEAGGKSRKITIELDAGETAGIERMMAIAVRAREDVAEPTRFSFLAQPRLEKRDFPSTRQGTWYGLFADAAFGMRKRDTLRIGKHFVFETDDKRGRKVIAPILADTLMEVFSWRLVE